jgi:hypothetical protein
MMHFAAFDKSRNDTMRSFPDCKSPVEGDLDDLCDLAPMLELRRKDPRPPSARADERVERQTANRGATGEWRRVGAQSDADRFP